MPEQSKPMARPQLPASHLAATLRSATPYCAVRDAFGVSFDVPALQGPVRLALSRDEMCTLLEVLGGYYSRAGLGLTPAAVEGAHG